MDQNKMKKMRIALRIFKNLAGAKIKAAGGQMSYREAYDHFLEMIEEARLPKSRMETRDENSKLIRELIDSIEEIVGSLFSRNFRITEELQMRITSLMKSIDEAILIYPFGEEIKLVPQTKLLSDSVLPVFLRAVEMIGIDKNEAWLSFMDVEARISKFREEAERERLTTLELVYPIVERLKEKSEPELACC